MIWRTLGVILAISLFCTGTLIYKNKQLESAILALQNEATLQRTLLLEKETENTALKVERDAKEEARKLAVEESAQRRRVVEELYRQIQEVEQTNEQAKIWGDEPIPSSYLQLLDEARSRVRHTNSTPQTRQSPVNGNTSTKNTGK